MDLNVQIIEYGYWIYLNNCNGPKVPNDRFEEKKTVRERERGRENVYSELFLWIFLCFFFFVCFSCSVND